MLCGLAKFLRDIFTEADGHSFDMKRLLWAIGCVWFMGVATYAVAKGQAFDPLATATGLTGLLVGGGAAIAMNRKGEE